MKLFAILVPAIAGVLMLLTACGSAHPAVPARAGSPQIAFRCVVGRDEAGFVPGPAAGPYLDYGAYRVTAFNRNGYPVTVTSITIAYYGPDGQEAGSDSEFFGDGGQVITGGQHLTETGFSGVPPGSFLCNVVSWD
jgi:hypothetical protein